VTESDISPLKWKNTKAWSQAVSAPNKFAKILSPAFYPLDYAVIQQFRLPIVYLRLTTVIVADTTWSLCKKSVVPCVQLLVFWSFIKHTNTQISLLSYKKYIIWIQKESILFALTTQLKKVVTSHWTLKVRQTATDTRQTNI